MNREHETNILKQIIRGIEEHEGQALLVIGASGSTEIASLVRAGQGEWEQVLGLLTVATVLSGTSLYHFYKEGKTEEKSQK